MSLAAAAFIPAAPLLIPDLAGAATARDEPLRDQVRHVVTALADAAVASQAAIVVVGPAPATGPQSGTWDLDSLGLPLRGVGEGSLTPGLGVGAWFLDEAGYAGPRVYLGVAPGESAETCALIGRELAADDVMLLVVGDGSARRTESAPGHIDARAEAWDATVLAALASADTSALLALDEQLGRELLCAGRAPWQVLAGAAGNAPFHGEVTYADAPYGVGYLTGRWQRA